MRLVTFRPGSEGEFGAPDHRAPDYRVALVMDDGHLVPLSALAHLTPTLDANFGRMELAAIIARDPDLERIREALARVDARALAAAELDPATILLAPPIPHPGKIIGVGNNYLDHIREQGLEVPARPVFFSMFDNAVTADGLPIRHPAGTHALDLEGELAVVVGRRASRVSPAEAIRCVAGYTAANDVSARDWQGHIEGVKGDGQWLRAKGSDTFLPLGPVLVTADELGDGRGLAVRSWLTQTAGAGSGAGAAPEPFKMQESNTRHLLFGVGELISMISEQITLEPGDIVVTGTPGGVGVNRTPPIFLQPGDVVTVEVEGIGQLTNPVTNEDGSAPEGSPAARQLATPAGRKSMAR
jgi:2-keto-4-pentenoate hydratase/2-oxohepta-3-ene-1,7-dioic acid hydratase in catechol pathway